MFQWTLLFSVSILSGLRVPNFLYIFTMLGTLSIKVTFSTSCLAFSVRLIFSANSPPFVFTGDTDFFISSLV